MPYQQSIEEITKEFKTHIQKGLNEKSVKNKKALFGDNKYSTQDKKSLIWLLVQQFLNPLMFILFISAFISLYIHEYSDAFVIFMAALLNLVVGFVQEWKADNAARALKNYEVTHVKVRRDGGLTLIDSKDLVPGDIVLLTAGDTIAADIRLIQVLEITTDESLLTGESNPIEKHADVIVDECPLSDRANMAFAGSHILTGKGEGIVIAIGSATQIGIISDLVISTPDKSTPLENQIKKFSWQLTFLMVTILFVIGIIGFSRDLLVYDFVKISLALAVAAVPEGLLVSFTAILALGMNRMFKRKALVRNLLAAETLGSVGVICTDKTGTLTQGAMRVVRIATSQDDYRLLDYSQSSLKKLNDSIKDLLLRCALNNDAKFHDNKIITNNVTDSCLLSLANLIYNVDGIRNQYSRIMEIPFSSAAKYMATLHHFDGKYLLIAKGAPEQIFSMCTPNSITPFEEAKKDMLSCGLRLLAIAEKTVTSDQVNLSKEMNNLTCVGVVGMQDPLRNEAKNTVKKLREAGINIVLVTGDHPDTALTIAREIDLEVSSTSVLTGKQLDDLEEQDLTNVIEDINIFARVEPRHKICIVDAWQKKGAAVAMTGDGVNDAPALKLANIGVALGSGSDVAKEVADIVLLDDNLASIFAAVKEGRVIFDNIRKIITYLMTNAFTEIILILLALLFNLPLPITVTQILWINLITDSFPNLALLFEDAEPSIMKDPPRLPNSPIVNTYMKWLIFVVSITVDIGLFIFYYHAHFYAWWDMPILKTIMFTSVAMISLLYVFSIKSMRSFLWYSRLLSNKWLLFAVLCGVGTQVLVIHTPYLQRIFDTVALDFMAWVVVVILAFVKLVAIELFKYFFLKFHIR